MDNYVFERISNENLKHVQALYSNVYSRNISRAYLEGKYNTKPFGAGWLGYVALTHDRKPVAFYGLVPCHFRMNEQTLLAAQAVDAMTHINYRNKKIFVHLAKQTHNKAREEGIQFIFGFPNQNSYPGLVRLGWQFTATPMQLFILNGSRFPIAKLILRLPIFKGVYQLLQRMNFNDKVETVDWSSRNGVVRDKLFVQHKSQYTETFFKKWLGVSAWMKNDGVLKIGLLQFDTSIDSSAVVGYIKKIANTLGCKTILFMTSSNSQLFRALTTITASKAGLPIGFLNLTNRHIDFNQIEFEYCDIDIF